MTKRKIPTPQYSIILLFLFQTPSSKSFLIVVLSSPKLQLFKNNLKHETFHHSINLLQSLSISNRFISILSLFFLLSPQKYRQNRDSDTLYELCSFYLIPSAEADGNPHIKLFVNSAYDIRQINLTVRAARFKIKNLHHKTSLEAPSKQKVS